ncbi:Lrp/AsnC family transcriptional regulator [Halalkalibacterium halodurans]|jgi:Lrp/AsnC family leucine-responsive transcriptional regulator|uniref:Transcriptional regulator (Lrp/AsnC family) n=2 Tax=Halalkalibacterium halodurans TaxID=86665 RepID=Q9K655_HALH5|nr:Lrp/AsnC family transcriptional regulator [Halalkalibacterium halodurans]MED3645849.1 Lrp/AsnC family transcriptional regulator [Halalkalibacterium halodurans]MED4079585.1 Lrp/AsnC family transcriptional regulator [Halalkalibacterium halodurans]MED4084138.1 Lrp/AsnC family transcriptional regulator [Halalkalibacterium halodurans]MED4104616.1 Lrp/AsnC family transcriptional regulator [Halalkalibacterium halodurans]MED4108344.1 Lrp/AsnC family transcriptional regulator [Halalkalibacterium hal
MDKLDIKLLELLQKNARTTISELSKELALSRPSVSERLQRLQESGVIEEYSARISLAGVGRDMLLIILVSGLRVPLKDFEDMVKSEEMIIECHRVTGEVSYMLKAAVPNMNSMRILIDKLIPYGNINTSTVIGSPVPYRYILPVEKDEEQSDGT